MNKQTKPKDAIEIIFKWIEVKHNYAVDLASSFKDVRGAVRHERAKVRTSELKSIITNYISNLEQKILSLEDQLDDALMTEEEENEINCYPIIYCPTILQTVDRSYR